MGETRDKDHVYRVLKKVDVERTMTWLLSMQPTIKIADLLRHMALLNFNTTDKRAYKQFARQYAQERELVGEREVGPEMITEYFRIDAPKPQHVFTPDAVVRSIAEATVEAPPVRRSQQLAVPATRPVNLGPERRVFLTPLYAAKGRYDIYELLRKYPDDAVAVTPAGRRDMDIMLLPAGTDATHARTYYAVEMGLDMHDARACMLRSLRRMLNMDKAKQNAAA